MLNFDEVVPEVRRIIKDEMLQIPFLMSALIGANMEKGNRSTRIAPSTSNRVATQSGNLFQSFVPNKAGNLTKFTDTGGVASVEYGSKLEYARVHELGAFIRTKGKMEGFFWARYRETKLPYYRNIALKIRHRGGVQIPARPFFAPAVEEFKKDQAKFTKVLALAIIKGIQSWQEEQR